MKKTVSIIGGGAAGLMLAACLDESKYDITIYEQNNTLGRKFLVAGDGGLNLTHSEHISSLLNKYKPLGFLDQAIKTFPNTALISWLKHLGIETYIGSSARIFPIKGIKPIHVLMTIIEFIQSKNIDVKCNHNWTGWSALMNLTFQYKEEPIERNSDIVVFAMGGASWRKTGSTGMWANLFLEKNFKVNPFQASNCAYGITWQADFIKIAEGKSLKNIAIQCEQKNIKGELVITQFGIEGGAIYALSPEIRKQLKTNSTATIFLDLKPQFTLSHIASCLKQRGNQSIQKVLSSIINCSSESIALLKSILTKEEFVSPNILAQRIKSLPLFITSSGPIDEAISTVGGIALSEINPKYELKSLPNHYVIGEMLDWDAPTGGYLLQASFSMGYYLAKSLNEKN